MVQSPNQKRLADALLDLQILQTNQQKQGLEQYFDTPGDALFDALTEGFTKDQIMEGYEPGVGHYWRLNDPVLGNRYGTPEEARMNMPDGFQLKPITATDGTQWWSYERIPEPERPAAPDNWDDLIYQTYINGGSELALKYDAFRDKIEAKAVTPIEAMNFAMQVATDSQSFQDISKLAMTLGGGGVSSDFLTALGAGATAFGGNLNDIMSAIESPVAKPISRQADRRSATAMALGLLDEDERAEVMATAGPNNPYLVDFPYSPAGDLSPGPSVPPGGEPAIEASAAAEYDRDTTLPIRNESFRFELDPAASTPDDPKFIASWIPIGGRDRTVLKNLNANEEARLMKQASTPSRDRPDYWSDEQPSMDSDVYAGWAKKFEKWNEPGAIGASGVGGVGRMQVSTKQNPFASQQAAYFGQAQKRLHKEALEKRPTSGIRVGPGGGTF